MPMTEIFYQTKHSIAMVNHKPIVPGHILVIPRRLVERMADLQPDEVADLYLAVQRVGVVVQREFKCTALTISMQDGRDAGQSVYHVHVHVLPRKPGDFQNNDDIYPALENSESQFSKDIEATQNTQLQQKIDLEKSEQQAQLKVDDEERKPRTLDEMTKEAAWLSGFF